MPKRSLDTALDFIRNETDVSVKKNDNFDSSLVYNYQSSELLDEKIGTVSSNQEKEGIFLENSEMEIETKNKISELPTSYIPNPKIEVEQLKETPKLQMHDNFVDKYCTSSLTFPCDVQSLKGTVMGIDKQNDPAEIFREEIPSNTLQGNGFGTSSTLLLSSPELRSTYSKSGLNIRENLPKHLCTTERYTDESVSARSMKKDIKMSAASSQVGIEDPLPLIDQIKEINNPTSQVSLSPEKAIITESKKKLLILDLNGLLADVVYVPLNDPKAEGKVGRNSVFKRPFCDDFLRFCFERFNIGVWSSRKRRNVDGVIDCVMADLKQKLLFCWDQSKCTDTGFKTIQDKHKPLFLKELSKLWNKEDETLPWEKGAYNPSNTLLLDDSPYKAICNPVNTGIFPCTYRYTNMEDNSLGPDGDIRNYLEGLTLADDVQQYVHDHPFGQSPITAEDPSWHFYLKVIKAVNPSFFPLHNNKSSQISRPSLATTSKSIHHPLTVAISDRSSSYETDCHVISSRNSFDYSHSIRTENSSLSLSQPIECIDRPLHNPHKIITEDPSWHPSHPVRYVDLPPNLSHMNTYPPFHSNHDDFIPYPSTNSHYASADTYPRWNRDHSSYHNYHHSPVERYPAHNNAIPFHRPYSVASRDLSWNQYDTRHCTQAENQYYTRAENWHYTRAENQHYTQADNQHYTRPENQHYTRHENQHYTRHENQHYTRHENQHYTRDENQHYTRDRNHRRLSERWQGSHGNRTRQQHDRWRYD